ncbi:MAG: glycoside hydrolase family 15 protein [Actinomycetota bacterium]
MSDTPIGEHAIISDCRSAALIDSRGSIEWLCFPRFDGPSVFARLLDAGAGHWELRPAGSFEHERRYLERTLVLEQTYRTPTGTIVVTEAMAVGKGETGHDLGAGAPGLVLRRAMCTDGEVEMQMTYAPRPEYGLVTPILMPEEGGVRARGGADLLLLSASVPLKMDGAAATAGFRLSEGDRALFSLEHQNTWEPPPELRSPQEIDDRLEDTIHGWKSWSAVHQNYEGPWKELVYHSGCVLQGLSYQPTGAIVAAATTSLPESVGGERNWDYRYAWVRDASFTLEALWVAACPDEAHRFFGYMAGATASSLRQGGELQIMFGIGGEHDLSERTLPHLSGWRNSAPVRVGNDAWDQRQLDVYGEILGAAHRLIDATEQLDATSMRFLVDAADIAAARWKETDEGIWEVRGGQREFLYSKVMCWAALDRAIDLADRIGAQDRVEDWTATRQEIRDAVLTRGWSEKAQAFAQAFDSDALDGSVLMMPIVGFLGADDPRMRATIDAIEERLTDDRGLVYRYLAEDGLEGDEGTFLLCTFWLAQALAMAGEVDRARVTFERAIRYVNDVGLLAEEVDPATGELLGNFPQAFSHIGLINAAAAIADAEERATS